MAAPMTLTGSVFPTALAILTVAAFVALIVWWPTLAGRRIDRIISRAGALLAVNALALLTAGAVLNSQFLFFADWSDLTGSLHATSGATALHRGGDAGRATRVVASGASAKAGLRLPPLPRNIGASGLISDEITGPLSGIRGRVVVQLPPGYTAPDNATERYPVLETFPGYPATTTQWTHTMRLGSVMADQVAANRMRSALIVSPQVEIPRGVDTECVNGAGTSAQLETWLAQDVPNWVTRTFRVRTDRASWATIGLSTGGWCAAMVAMLHPAQYSAAIVMGGYFQPEFGPLYQPYRPQSSLANRYDLVRLAHRAPPPVALWLETSHADPVSYRSSAALLDAARRPMAINALVLRNAGHRISLWQGLLPRALDWLGADIPGFSGPDARPSQFQASRALASTG
jgi:enterochelin esterase-like enzyme